jgi:spermidine synthase
MESRRSLLNKLALFNLGLTAMGTQIVMIREFLAVLQGNELIIGMLLGCWMLLTAMGSYLSTKTLPVSSSKFAVRSSEFAVHSSPDSPPPRLPAPMPPCLLAILGLLPLAMLFALSYLHSLFIPAGVTVGIGEIFLVSLLVLSPFCFLSGMLFPLLVSELSVSREKNMLYQGYALDSAGGILGGLLFSLIFIFMLSSYESLLVLTCSCFLLVIAWRHGGMGAGRRGSAEAGKIGRLGDWQIGRFGGWEIWGIVFSGILLIILISSYLFKPDRLLNRHSFKGQDVLEVKTTPFGKISVTKIGDQLNIYENAVPLATGDDPAAREEPVHYAMLMHPDPRNVLLISGGTGGTIDELLKYPSVKIDYLEINPWMIRLIDKYRPFPKESRIKYIFEDARKRLSLSGRMYDVIILNTPEPLSAELNRFYTVEFFQLLNERLHPGGIISVPVAAAGNYMNETSRMMHSVLYNSLQTVFRHIRIIPGDKDYFLASQASLDGSFLKKYLSAGFTNIYVNPSYVNEDLQKMRSDLIIKDLIPKTPINSDLKPTIFSLSLTHWLERFKMDPLVFPVALAIFIVVAFLFLGPLNLGLFASGFTASALEFMLLIWFQVMYGNIFQMTGVIFAVFMAGLAIGSIMMHLVKNAKFKGFLALQAGIALFSGLVAILMFVIPTISAHWTIILLILALVFITGLLTGAQFSLNGTLRDTSIHQSSGESFSADLLGSAIGIVLVSVYLIPHLGLPMTGLAMAGLNVVALVVMVWRR